MARGNKSGDSEGAGGSLSDDQLAQEGFVGDHKQGDASGSASQSSKDKAAEKAGKDFDKQYDESKGDKD
jgi:hypothetical protein